MAMLEWEKITIFFSHLKKKKLWSHSVLTVVKVTSHAQKPYLYAKAMKAKNLYGCTQGRPVQSILGFISSQKASDSLWSPWPLICFSLIYSLPCVTSELKHAARSLLVIQQYINSSKDKTLPIRENRDVIHLFKIKWAKLNLSKTLFRLQQQSLLYFPCSSEANELARNCVLREHYCLRVSSSIYLRAYRDGTVCPSLKQSLQLRFEAAPVLPYTLTYSEKILSHLIPAVPWISMVALLLGSLYKTDSKKMFLHGNASPGPLHISSIKG